MTTSVRSSLYILKCSVIIDSDCTEDQFSCDDGRCIMIEHRCDGTIHCRDTTDEMNCPAELHKGFTIHNLTTETGEAETESRRLGKDRTRTETYCQGSELPCASVHGCIPRAWFCDGERDCEDGSDEGTHCKFAKMYEPRQEKIIVFDQVIQESA